MTDKIKILLVDDHAVVRAGLKHVLSEATQLEVVAEAGAVAEALAQLQQHDIDVVVLDLTLRTESGMDFLRSAKQERPAVRVLILSAFGENQYALQALKAGADGYLHKDSAPESLIAAVQRVAAGRKYISPELAEKLASGLIGVEPSPHEKLSEREFQILRLIASGVSLTAIAEQLKISTKTVTSYRARVLQKTGLTTNADLVRYAIERGLLQ